MANMTEREFLTAILAIDNLPDNLATYANDGIAKLDARNDKRKNTQSKAQKENEGIMDAIVRYLTDKGASVASEIGSALGISTQKASALCVLLEKSGRVTVTEVKVKGKGKLKQYAVADGATADEAEDSAD